MAFRSTTAQLTTLYVLLLIIINLISATVYFNVSIESTNNQLNRFYAEITDGLSPSVVEMMSDDRFEYIHSKNIDRAMESLAMRLSVYILVILILSGWASYLISRYTIKPVEETHAAQKRFASSVSHELSTPLAAMKSEIEVALRDKRTSQQKLRETLGSTLEEIDDLSDVIDAMIMMSQLDDSKRIEKQDLDLKLTVAEAAYRFRKQSHRIVIDGEVGIEVSGNELLLTELFVTLIDNALKYGDHDTPVTIRVGRSGARSIVEVQNTGVAIPEDEHIKIFERFYRTDSARTHGKSTSGFGLGLSIAAQIADLHDARISIKTPDSRTTIFQVFF